MGSSWCAEYFRTLKHRDKKEKANEGLVNACKDAFLVKAISTLSEADISAVTKLADERVLYEQARLEKELPFLSNREPSLNPTSTTSDTRRLRDDLASAQRSRGQLQAQIDSMEYKLRSRIAILETDRLRIADLKKSLQNVMIKLRDKDEELKGKAKLLEVSKRLNLWNDVKKSIDRRSRMCMTRISL